MITRQHSDTTITELHGQVCESLIGPGRSPDEPVLFMFLKIEGGNWHRFDIDINVLFWQEGAAPDPEDDLDEGEQYIDYGLYYRVNGATIRLIEMRDCGKQARLTMSFDNGSSLHFESQGERPGMAIVQVGQSSHG